MAAGYYDFSGAFGNLNRSLANLGQANEKAWQSERQADAAKDFASGNYAGAAGKLAALGQFDGAASLAKLGQTQKQEADWMRENGGALGLGGGQASAPAAAPAAGYFASTRTAESSGDDAAKNPNSTATGRYQFLRGTWDGLMRSNPELALTADGRNDPQQQERAVRAFTAQNAEALRAKGVDPNDRNLYMTHFLGAGAAPNFISAVQQDPTVPATSLVSPQVANANRAVFFDQSGAPRSAGDVYQRMTARFGGGSTAVAAMGGGAAPVQVAQAPGGPQPDAVAPGAANAQGYFIPPGGGADVSVANDPQVLRYQRALVGAPDRAKAFIQSKLDMATKDAERRYSEGRAPEAVREFQHARQQGWTNARTPVEYAGEKAAAQREEKDRAEPLRKEIHQLPSYKNLAQAAPIYRSMFETAGRNTKASDLNLIYGLGKIMDPTSVVREGEMALAQGTSGLDQRLVGYAQSIMGGAALTPETREALMAEAYSRMDTYREQFDQDATQYRGIVERRQLNPADVIPNIGEYSRWERQKPAAKGGPAPTAAAAQPLPQGYVDQYRRPDGSSPPLPGAPAPQPATGTARPKGPVRIQGGMTPDMIKQRFAPGTKLILPDGTEGVVK